MFFLRTVAVLLLKDVLLALRRPFMTICEIGLPIVIGFFLYPDSVDLTATPGMVPMKLSSNDCKAIDLFYVNEGPNKTEIEEIIGKGILRNRTNFKTEAEMIKQLEKIESVGIVFETLDSGVLAYKIYSAKSSASIKEFLTMTPDDTVQVFSTETYRFDLLPVNTTIKEYVEGVIQYCLLMPFTGHFQDVDYSMVDVRVVENPNIKRCLIFLHDRLVFLMLPVLISTAFIVASEKETGMKEFVVVIGVKKYMLFLEHTIFSMFKAMFIVASVTAKAFWTLPASVLLIVVYSTILLIFGIVMIGMFCAALCTSAKSAIDVSTMASSALIVFWLKSDVFNRKSYLPLLDIFTAYKTFLSGVRLSYVRGKDIVSAMFMYDDIVNIGTPLIFLILDVTLTTVLVLFIDYIPIKTLLNTSIKNRFSTKEDFEHDYINKHSSHEEIHENSNPTDSNAGHSYSDNRTPCEEMYGTSKSVDSVKRTSETTEGIADTRDEESTSWNEENKGIGKPVLSVDSISKTWETTGERAVVRFSMEAYRGQVTVLLGRNGAGKSTTYAMVCGTTPATEGMITILGKRRSNSIWETPAPIGFCPQSNCLYDNLTVEDHLWLFFVLKRGKGEWKDEADLLCTQLEMSDLMGKRANKLSGGEKRKLCLAMAFIGGSELIMLDEPTVGMDPQSRILVKKLVEEKKKTRAVVLTTHYLDEAEAMGDFVYILHMGSSLCSGTPHFLKAKFASGIILNVVFQQDVSKDSIEATCEVVSEQTEGVQIGVVNGCQARFELPKSLQSKIPQLFSILESKKEALQIANFGVSLYALEEVFLKVGKSKEEPVEEPCNFARNSEIATLHEGHFVRMLQQVLFLLLKRVADFVHNGDLLNGQVIFPVLLVVIICLNSTSDIFVVSSISVPDMSLKRIRHGRFLIYDPYNNTEARTHLEKALNRYPNIEIVHHNITTATDKALDVWPREYPWAVGGAELPQPNSIEKIKSEYPKLWLIPWYMHHKELTFFHFITNLAFNEIKEMQLHVSYTSTSRNIVLQQFVPNLFFLAMLSLHTSVAVFLTEEKACKFRHQQMLAGLSPAVHWITTLVYDAFTTSLISVILFLLMALQETLPKWGLLFYTCAYNTSMLPVVYMMSLITDEKGRAYCLCALYEVFPLLAVPILGLDVGRNVIFFPSYVYYRKVSGEMDKLSAGNLDFTNEEMICSFVLQGVAFFALVFAYEYHLERPILRTVFKKAYVEKSEVPDAPDVITERSFVRDNFSQLALAVENLTKYYGPNCAVKRTTYGVRAEDCFGLVGATGSGKTSTFDIITGIRRASDGRVFIGNQFVNRTQGIGYCPQFDAMLPRLSCRLNMLIIAGIIGYKQPQLVVDEMLQFLDLEEHCSKKFGSCSGGQKRRISIGVALMNPSKLVILDEPTSGIDPETRHRVWALLQAMRISGRALVLSSHSMEECEAICSRIGILVKGRLVAIGPSQALKSMHANFLYLFVVLKSLDDKEEVMTRVVDTFPASSLVTKREDSLALKFKIPLRGKDKMSTMYAQAQAMRSTISLDDCILVQSALDDVLENLNERYSGKIL